MADVAFDANREAAFAGDGKGFSRTVDLFLVAAVERDVTFASGDVHLLCGVGVEVVGAGENDAERFLLFLCGQDGVGNDFAVEIDIGDGVGTDVFKELVHKSGWIGKENTATGAWLWRYQRRETREKLRAFEDRLAGRAEIVTSVLEAIGECDFGFFQVGTWIVELFVADFAVDFQHAFDVLADVGNDRAGEGVLRIGVDIHFHDAVVEGFADVGEFRAGAAVEYEIHFGLSAVLGGNGGLTVAQDGRLELDGAGLVSAVNVTESSGKKEAADGLKGFVHGDHVFWRGVELVGRNARGVVTVFFATDDASFDFEDDIELDAFFEQFLGNAEIFLEGEFRAVKHVALEQGAFASGDALARSLEERLEEAFYFGWMAVIGVQSDEDVVFFCEAMNGFGKNDGTEGGVRYFATGGELSATSRDLDNAVAFGFGEGAESAVDGGDGSYVDGWVGVSALLSGIKHGTVLRGCSYWHNRFFYN